MILTHTLIKKRFTEIVQVGDSSLYRLTFVEDTNENYIVLGRNFGLLWGSSTIYT